MPNIYKQGYIQEDEDTVLIPDFIPPAPEPEPSAEEEGDRPAPSSAPPPPPPAPPPVIPKEEIEARVAKEVDRLRKEAEAKAYRDTSARMQEEMRGKLQQVDKALCRMEEEHQEFLLEYRDRLSEFALDIAEKIILHKIAKDDAFFKDLVMHAIQSIKNAEWISVEVSDNLAGLVDQLQQELRNQGASHVEISARMQPEGACVLETPEGVIDASVSEQIKNIREGFASVSS